MDTTDGRIRKDYTSEIRGLAPGQTMHVCHKGCPAGEDHRHRLYLTRSEVPTNVILWYCHNCGQGGGFKESHLHLPAGPSMRTLVPPKDNREAAKVLLDRSVMLTDANDVAMECPIAVADWLYGGTFDQTYFPFQDLAPIYYDPLETSIIFTLRDPDGITGYQRRFFTEKGPKCLTMMLDGHKGSGLWLDQALRPHTRVLVEDPISAHMVIYWATQVGLLGTGAYAMLGSDCSIENLFKMKEDGTSKVVIWMDNDNEQVLKNRETIRARAERLGLEVQVVRKWSDPKKHQNALRKLLVGGTIE